MSKILLVFLFLTGCSIHPTPYQKEKKKEGYSDGLDDEIRIARFIANSSTKGRTAQKYAEFRAIEYCREVENTHANIIDISDKSRKKNVIKTSGGSWGPSFAFGMYPYYSRYSSFGMGLGYHSHQTESWSETLTYPEIEVFYRCSDYMIRPQLILKEISSENMRLLVKDLKGALQVEEISTESINRGIIEIGDIILKANEQRIEKVYDFINLFQKRNSIVHVQLLRDGERKEVNLKGREVTQDALNAEDSIIHLVCQDKNKKYQKKLKKSNICLFK
jgi:hypothetical protein